MSYLNTLFEVGFTNLKQSPEALQYLAARGMSFEQLELYRPAYFGPDTWPPYINPAKANPAERVFLSQSGNGVKLRGKILFPMYNAMGEIRAFQAGLPDLDQSNYWKFFDLRSGIDGVFFGLKQAMPYIWATQEVVLAEGVYDVLPLQRSFPMTIGVGTADLTKNQLKFLLRYVKRVRLAFDNDEFGEKFCAMFSRKHGDKFSVDMIPYLGKDPNDSWKRLGEEVFQQQFARFVEDSTQFSSLSS